MSSSNLLWASGDSGLGTLRWTAYQIIKTDFASPGLADVHVVHPVGPVIALLNVLLLGSR